MKRILLLLIIVFTIIFSACERDDICIDAVTPNLVVKFFDKDNPTEVKAVTNVVMKIKLADGDRELTITNDTIAKIPILVTQDATRYTLTKTFEDKTTKEDAFTLNYAREEVFVGRSCGYKMIFNDISLSNIVNNWTNSLALENTIQKIENESTPHVKIYH